MSCYHINSILADKNIPLAAVNTAVEESSLSQREDHGLLPHDQVIARQLTEQDVLVVSLGGNDVALRPSIGVIASMAALIYATPSWCIEKGPAFAPALWYFIHMFKTRMRTVIEKICATKKPRRVVMCML
jgi:hypothetical protein